MNPPQKQSNKIAEIVKLQQLLKKWRKRASSRSSSKESSSSSTSNNGGIGFLKRTLSSLSMDNGNPLAAVPKGFVAVSVGQEMVKRFVVPMEYLSREVFSGYLLKEAEEMFGFQQEGVLRIPCRIEVFEMIVKAMEDYKDEDALVMMKEYYDNGSCSRGIHDLSPSTSDHNRSTSMCK